MFDYVSLLVCSFSALNGAERAVSSAPVRVALLACRAVNKVSFKTFLSSEKERFAFLKPRKQHFAQRKVVPVRLLTPKTVMLREDFLLLALLWVGWYHLPYVIKKS